MANKIRYRLILSGFVQGVGLRYHACRAAEYYGVTGWVRNCDDGTVEIEVEGLEESIDKMLQKLDESPFIRIYGIEKTIIPLEHDLTFKETD